MSLAVLVQVLFCARQSRLSLGRSLSGSSAALVQVHTHDHSFDCLAQRRKNGVTQLDPQRLGCFTFACTKSWLRALNPPFSQHTMQVLHNTNVVV
jgi:hypothetical protein